MKSRLKDLKEQLKSDDIQLNTEDLYASPDEFPTSPNNDSDEYAEKYIDYVAEQKKHTEFATQVINNIVTTYVKSPELLNSNRLRDLKQQDILDYSFILLMINIANKNLIKLQELIDSGDMSKEAFDSVTKAAKELRDNMKLKTEHLTKCEKYWDNYSSTYGLGNEEQKIATRVTDKNKENETKTSIVNPQELIEIIQKQQEQMKQNLKDNKQNKVKKPD